MKNHFKKIVGSLGVMAVMLSVALFTHQDDANKQLISAAAFEDINLQWLDNVHIAPAGTVRLSAGQSITINAVYFYLDDGGGSTSTEIVEGEDLVIAPIGYNYSTEGAPSTPIRNQNVFTMPDDFTTGQAIIIDELYIPNSLAMDDLYPLATPLRIEALPENFCSPLQTSFILPQGGGLEPPEDPADLPDPATTVNDPIDFDGLSPITSLSFQYLSPEVEMPVTVPDGARQFDIQIDVVPGLVTDARLVSSNAETNSFFGEIREEGDPDDTRDNFVKFINAILGVQSPFVASTGSNSTAQLTTKERGLHVNDYSCIINNGASSECFSGGAAGSVDVLVVPTSLNNVLLQGESTLGFVNNGTGPYEWTSSDEGVVELKTFLEAGQNPGSANFNTTPLVGVPVHDSASANIEINECTTLEDETGPYGSNCDEVLVENMVVNYDISAIAMTADVAVGDQVVQVDLSGGNMTGNFSGAGPWVHESGTSFQLDGYVEGPVSGTAPEGTTGTLTGTVRANVSISLDIDNPGGAVVTPVEQTIRDGLDALLVGDFNEQQITGVSGSFDSTIQTDEAAQTNPFILAQSIDPGNAIISVTDSYDCVAAIDVTVSEMKLFLQGLDGDTLKPGDNINLQAFIGWDSGEVDFDNNVTAAPGIEWFSSNEEVATVDGTGIVSIFTAGNTNITARFDTGIPEIGTIESDPLAIEVAGVTDLTISLDQSAWTKLPGAVLDEAMDLVTISIHDPDAVGSSLLVEGNVIPIEYNSANPDSLTNDIERLNDIILDLGAALENLDNSAGQPALLVSPVPGKVGVITLQPFNQNADYNSNGIINLDENGRVDVSFTGDPENLSVLPQFTNLVNLSAFETYALSIIGELSDGRTRVISPTDPKVTWVNTPLNYLDPASLEAGLIKLGETVGTSGVKAEYQSASGAVSLSNTLTVVAEEGPVIDSIWRTGSGPIFKGTRTNWHARISDSDGGMNTLANINAYIVSSSFSTYQEIIADPYATWFTTEVVFENVTSSEPEPAEPAAPEPEAEPEESEGGEEESSEESEPEESPESEAEPESAFNPVFRIFNIPVDIPVSQNLFDGPYKLVFSLGDIDGNFTEYVIPITIGDLKYGDATGDGIVNLLDVVAIFRIVTGSLTPNAYQADTSDINQDGKLNLIDVILAFQLAVK